VLKLQTGYDALYLGEVNARTCLGELSIIGIDLGEKSFYIDHQLTEDLLENYFKLACFHRRAKHSVHLCYSVQDILHVLAHNHCFTFLNLCVVAGLGAPRLELLFPIRLKDLHKLVLDASHMRLQLLRHFSCLTLKCCNFLFLFDLHTHL